MEELLNKLTSEGVFLTPEEFERFFTDFSSKQGVVLLKEDPETKIPKMRTLFLDGSAEGLEEGESVINFSRTILKWMYLAYAKLYKELEKKNEGII